MGTDVSEGSARDHSPSTTPPPTGKSGPGFLSRFLGNGSSLGILKIQNLEPDPG